MWAINDPYFEITSKCNLRCKHCYNSSDIKNSNVLSLEVLEKSFKYFSNIGAKKISISGGEPLVHPHLLEILKVANMYGLSTLLVTNGVLLNDEIINKMKDYLFGIQISIDGDEKNHDLIRGEGNFEKSIIGIENLHRYGLNKITRVRMTISNINLNDLEALVELARKYELEAVQFSVVRKQGRLLQGNDEMIMSDTAMIDAFYKVEMLRKKYGKMGINIGRLGIDGGKCSLTNSNPVVKPRISSSGEVFACHAFDANIFSFGNINTDSYDEIFEKNKLLSFFEMLRQARNNTLCNGCGWSKSVCKGGCPAQAFLIDGTIDGNDGFCNVRSKIWMNNLTNK